MSWRGIYILFLLSVVLLVSAQSVKTDNELTAAQKAKSRWVDSVYNQLSTSEKIGQLFMVAAYSGGPKYNEAEITGLVNNGQIGGIIYMQGDPVSQAQQTNKLQQLAKVPLLIAMDAEWGLGMRLTGVKDLPRQMMIGATGDSMLAYKLGKAVADQSKRLGVHVDFAPVVDVNNNPNNPVINARSFGEDKMLVARLGIAYMNGLQKNGVMASAKHFPGHGDTDVDSHKDLPIIRKPLAGLDSVEFFPFKALIKAGVQSVMIAHLEVPALEPRPKVPTTLSKNTITNILKGKLGFKGLIYTDALNMQGVAKYYQPGEVDLLAFEAGNDVLLFSQDVPAAIAKIKLAYDQGQIDEARLSHSVRKILAAKYEAGLKQFKPINTTNLVADLNKDIAAIKEEAAAKSVTLVRDLDGVLGRINKGDAKVGYIGVNATQSELFTELRTAIPDLRFNWLPKGTTSSTLQKVKEGMSNNDVNLVVVHNMGFYPGSSGNYGLDAQQMKFIRDAESLPNVVYVIMGNPYLLKNVCDARGAIVAYEDDPTTQLAVAKVLLREALPQGRLPVTPCPGMIMRPLEPETPAEQLVAGKASTLRKVDFVEDAGVVNSHSLVELSEFMQRSIANKAFPGARIIAAKDGRIFYDEAFGYHDFGKDKRVDLNTIYDVASMTKVMSTTIAVMKLYDEGRLKLENTLGDYLPWTKGTNKSSITIKDLLLHQAGLKAWIPFYKSTLDAHGQPSASLYSKTLKAGYTVPVANDLFLRDDYPQQVWKEILESPVDSRKRYVYSDLDFYFLAAVVEAITKKPIDQYVDQTFYKPMGLKRISYNAWKKYSAADIAPTEQDVVFRKQLVKGYVHDPGAALFGGVAGHAGLFSTAQDAAAVFQMLLNGGSYNGKRFFKESTVRKFTAYGSSISRRGLGFDKPSNNSSDGGPAGNKVSGHAFGHQGFTGTAGWADPATGVVFIILTNRVNPSAENNQINRLSVRTVAQDYIYEALGLDDNTSRVALHRQQTR